MMPMGPQAGGGFMSPTPQQPQQMDPYAQWSMQNQARQEATMHAMNAGLLQQQQGNVMQGGMLAGRGLNSLAGNPIGQMLHPLGQAVQAGAGAVKGALGFGPSPAFQAGQQAAQSYTQGGATTLGSVSAAQAGLTEAPAATNAAAPAAGATTGQVAGGALGIAGAAYGAYEGFNSSNEAIRRLHEAQSYGLSPEEEAQLRQKTFNQGLVKAGIGGVGGALEGSAFGPVGIAAGAVLGGAPGAVQAWQSQPDNQSRFQAQVDFQRNPFR